MNSVSAVRETVHILEYGQVEIRGIMGGPWFVYTRRMPKELVTSERFFTCEEAIKWLKKNHPCLLHAAPEVQSRPDPDDDDEFDGWMVTV